VLRVSFIDPGGRELKERKKGEKKQFIKWVYLTLLQLAIPSWPDRQVG
jgi:hypothetical protein